MPPTKYVYSIVLLSLLCFSSCSKKLRTYQPGDSIQLELEHGTLIQLGEEVVSIEFIQVVEDSRCPEGMQCIWAGRFIAELRINQKNLYHVGLFNHSPADPDAIAFIPYKNYKISILATRSRGKMKPVRYLILQVENV